MQVSRMLCKDSIILVWHVFRQMRILQGLPALSCQGLIGAKHSLAIISVNFIKERKIDGEWVASVRDT